MLPSFSGIYQVTNVRNGKVYIGSARDIRARQYVHLCQLRSGKHCNTHLLKAYRRYGEGSFQWEVLEMAHGDEALIAREQHWIDVRRAADRRHGYNIVDIARRVFSMTGRRHTEAARAKITASQIGVTRAVGEATGNCRLNTESVKDIRGLLAAGHSFQQVAQVMGVTKATIQAIANGRTWSHVTGKTEDIGRFDVPSKRVLRGAEIGVAKLQREQVDAIRIKLSLGALGKHLAVEYGLSTSQISSIRTGKSWAT
ncbi:GIY-YIG nuclease family protein [Mesorhizobium sp. M0768]|uniref:GIY-YIG nuclease family protein n=1 Tax=Mesorhizobium sp. M0768 TaxID=2956996 RepID=UPI00333D88F6